MMKKLQQKIKAGITHGDVNGISYEIIIKTFLDKRIYDFCIPVLYGSPKVFAYHRNTLKIKNLIHNNVRSVGEARNGIFNIINCVHDNIKVEISQLSEAAGIASVRALERACEDMKNGLLDILVTAPINKKNIQSKDFSFPGHTEFLTKKFDGQDSLMVLLNEKIKIGVVTGHIPLTDVSKQITQKKIIQKLQILNTSLIKDFFKVNPKIAVLGLNPHIGDDGVIGVEEQEIIIPAINKARESKIFAFGPYPADGFWGTFEYKNFDAVLAMYHDQGLIPFKMLAFEDGVNFTAGLPFVRTSPSHGTAYTIAGKGIASNKSFKQALFTAIDIYKNRKIYNEISANPLRKAEMKIEKQKPDKCTNTSQDNW